MSPRIIIALAVAGVVAFGAGMIVWVVVQPDAATETPAGTSRSGAAQREHRERFFEGDPDRDVRGGQEMKPRW
ncbi:MULTISPECIES: entry exclusion protein TrbK [Hyphomicrobiales]|uniref:Entry exclusion protein TrbK n=7 Tax=Rhizobium/Agrobacterium group TaxID=227290 RepID=A0A2Z2Q1F5_9HYPH|nr:MULTISPECIES: entry exclusion protein TrbK [Rhizobium/Agrobacterium group]KAA6481533.1 entry exclusion protein TrbK [Agrobacterium sp. ICMP 7243]ARU12276.1 conjugative transfer protein TrbK [Agrobacterium tumefaciens]ASK46574.1 entry exclusion protein TrbK [Rhizobium rhizogenes]ASK46741.1 entry exclusion protein TrbK [Agrobacterium radiobacter]ASK47259.1 entry exclusion protein TrbK [Agrobacterium tomkonis]